MVKEAVDLTGYKNLEVFADEYRIDQVVGN
jgi:hypothetical protein